jgi:hypothetical protein
MRTFNRALGIVSILWGIVQWRWNVWAFSASWHLGSPLRRADLPLVTDDSVQPKIFAEVIQTGMQVIHVLDRTLDLLVVNALVFIGLGIFLLWSSNKYERA